MPSHTQCRKRCVKVFRQHGLSPPHTSQPGTQKDVGPVHFHGRVVSGSCKRAVSGCICLGGAKEVVRPRSPGNVPPESPRAQPFSCGLVNLRTPAADAVQPGSESHRCAIDLDHCFLRNGTKISMGTDVNAGSLKELPGADRALGLVAYAQQRQLLAIGLFQPCPSLTNPVNPGADSNFLAIESHHCIRGYTGQTSLGARVHFGGFQVAVDSATPRRLPRRHPITTEFVRHNPHLRYTLPAGCPHLAGSEYTAHRQVRPCRGCHAGRAGPPRGTTGGCACCSSCMTQAAAARGPGRNGRRASAVEDQRCLTVCTPMAMAMAMATQQARRP